MKSIRYLIFGLALLGFAAAAHESAAQFPFKKKGFPPGSPANPGSMDTTRGADSDIFSAPLVATDLLTRLKLNADQKKEVAKCQTEFAAKLKDAVAKAKDDAAKNGSSGGGGAGKGKGKGGAARSGPETPGLSEALTLRSDYEDKVYDMLDEAQQKVWLDVKAKKGESLLTGGASGGSSTTPPKKKQ